jgi:hypothetical protein
MTSQINPLNIDGNYPVAGVPNNTQGFRDNFTNTQTNFEYAASEITELQNKAVLKSALTGGVLDNNMNDGLIYAVQLSDVSYKEVQQTATSGSVTIDYSAANYQAFPSITGSLSLGFANWPAAGTVGTLNLAFVVTNTAYTVTLPTAVSVGLKNIDGISPGTAGVSNTITFTATGTYVYVLETADGGNTISIQNTIRPSNSLNITSTTASTTTTSGALIVAGGLGLGGNIFAGGLASVVGNITGGNVNTTGLISVTGNVQGGNIRTAGLVSATGNVIGGNVTTAGLVSATGNVIGGNVTTVGTVRSSSTSAGIGYATGAGTTVTQTVSRTQGVQIDRVTGQITLVSAAGTSAYTTFVVTNSTVQSGDVIILSQKSGTDKYEAFVTNVTNGTFSITFSDTSGTTTEQPVFNFAVIKAVAA